MVLKTEHLIKVYCDDEMRDALELLVNRRMNDINNKKVKTEDNHEEYTILLRCKQELYLAGT